jgi:hypothetical protein
VKNKIIISVVGLIASLLVFDTCKNWRSVAPAEIVAEEASLEKGGVLISSKAYSSDESKTFLGTDMVDKGYQPVEISIQNNTSKTYKLEADKVTLPTASASKMTWNVTKGTIPRSIGYKVASFFFWPFMIPGTIDSFRTLKSHKNLKADLSAKILKDETIIPYSTVKRVLFVPKEEFKPDYQVILFEVERQYHQRFNVTAT